MPQGLQKPSQHAILAGSLHVPALGSLSGMSQHAHFRSPHVPPVGGAFTAALGGGLGLGAFTVPRGALGFRVRTVRSLRGPFTLGALGFLVDFLAGFLAGFVAGFVAGFGILLVSNVQKVPTWIMFLPVQGVGPVLINTLH